MILLLDFSLYFKEPCETSYNAWLFFIVIFKIQKYFGVHSLCERGIVAEGVLQKEKEYYFNFDYVITRQLFPNSIKKD